MLEVVFEVAPNDLLAMIGFGQALVQEGRKDDADELYERAIRQGVPPPIIEIANERRAEIAQKFEDPAFWQ